MDALDTIIAFAESEEFVPYAISTFALWFFVSMFATAMAIYLFCRKAELPTALNWKSDAVLACRALRFVLVQDKFWTLALLGWSVVWTVDLDFSSESALGSILFYSAWFMTSFCSVRLAWAVNRMIVVMKSPENLANYVPFKSCWWRLNLINLLWAIPATAGALLFAVPGVLYCLFACLSQASCSTTKNGIFASFRESFRLIKDNLKIAAKYLIPPTLLFALIPSILSIGGLAFDCFTVDFVNSSAPRSPVVLGISAAIWMMQSVLEFVQFGVMSALCTILYLNFRAQETTSS